MPELPQGFGDQAPAPQAAPPIQPGPIPDREAIQGVTVTPEGRTRIDIFASDKNKVSNVPSAGGTGRAIGSLPQGFGDQVGGSTAAPPPPMSGEVHDAIATNGSYSSILNAFGQGFAHEWGAAQFGPELKKAMTDAGILYGGKGEPTVGQAFNEAFLRPAANALDVSLRTITGIGQGIHEASIAAGHPYDALAAAMEAFPLAGAELGRLGWLPGRMPKLSEIPEEEIAKKGLAAAAYDYAKRKNIPDLGGAIDLGVIGPIAEKSPIADGTPAEAAARATVTYEERAGGVPQSVGAGATPLEERMMMPAGTPFEESPWQERFDHYIKKLQTSEDAKNLIKNSVDINDTFAEARAGEIPAAHLGALSDATGIPVEEMNIGQLRTKLDGPAKFRAATQMMLKLNDDVFEAARNHKTLNSFESRKALIEAIIKHDAAVEYVMGLRAEWGKTGNAMQEFLERSKDSKGLNDFVKDRRGEGWSQEKIDEIADQLGGLNSREEIGAYLAKMHKPDFIDRAVWYWTQSILSGPITHAKYIFANAAYIAHDTLIATPFAGVSGAIKQVLSNDQIKRVYMGEAAAKVYGLIAGVPDAIYASGRAIKSGVTTPLPGQTGVSQLNPITGLGPKPIPGIAGEVIGAPSRVISGIHSFFNFLGYRADVQAGAYRMAVKTGLSPMDVDFWKLQQQLATDPTPALMESGIQAGARANFVQDLGPSGKAVMSFLHKVKLGRFVVPFLKVPGNIFNAVQEGTPLAFLDARMRGDLLGKGVKQDMAIGRLAGGGAIMGWAAYETLAGSITGNGPIDPKERAEWLLTNQPRSVKIGNKWVSYNRFGPVGGWLSLSADITDASRDLYLASQENRMTATEAHKVDRDLQEGYARIVTGFANWFEEGGWQGLSDLVQAWKDPNRTRISNFGTTAQTILPFSSLLKQTASFIDPNMRETKKFIDGVRMGIPIAREGLLPRRDWTGAPSPNPMHHALTATRDVNTDSVDREMQRLDLNPTKPTDSIRGVKLTPERYDEYAAHAGTITRMALHQMVDQPAWQQFGDFAKSLVIERLIKASRSQAEAYMMLKYPDIINEGIGNKMKDIMGVKHKATAFERAP